jgi:hypothetical protein
VNFKSDAKFVGSRQKETENMKEKRRMVKNRKKKERK